jgi:hypothetical protein
MEAALCLISASKTCCRGSGADIAIEGISEQDEGLTYSVRKIGAAMNFPQLFSPLKVGPYQLKHRVALAPLTRMRAAKPSLAPRPLNAQYYAQRADRSRTARGF